MKRNEKVRLWFKSETSDYPDEQATAVQPGA